MKVSVVNSYLLFKISLFLGILFTIRCMTLTEYHSGAGSLNANSDSLGVTTAGRVHIEIKEMLSSELIKNRIQYIEIAPSEFNRLFSGKTDTDREIFSAGELITKSYKKYIHSLFTENKINKLLIIDGRMNSDKERLFNYLFTYYRTGNISYTFKLYSYSAESKKLRMEMTYTINNVSIFGWKKHFPVKYDKNSDNKKIIISENPIRSNSIQSSKRIYELSKRIADLLLNRETDEK